MAADGQTHLGRRTWRRQPANMTAKPGVAMSTLGLPGRQGLEWRRCLSLPTHIGTDRSNEVDPVLLLAGHKQVGIDKTNVQYYSKPVI
jgi:hypothetical protein